MHCPIAQYAMIRDARTFAFSAENPTGTRGGGGRGGDCTKLSPTVVIPAGETVTLVDIEGPGIIQNMWFTGYVGHSFILRIYWDDQAHPSVEAPLSAFFGCAYDENFVDRDGRYPVLNSAMLLVAPGRGYNCYFEMPFRRMLSDAAVPMRRADNGQWDINENYQINNPSPACPMGFGQEDVMKACWDDGDRLRRAYGNPEHLIRYGARDEHDPETGMKLPEKVVVYGSFQPFVGATVNDSNSEITRMYYIGDNTYTLSVVMPFAGEYDFGISTYGTLSAVYTHDRFPRSGSSPKAYFTTQRDNSIVRFRYRFIDNEVSVEIGI